MRMRSLRTLVCHITLACIIIASFPLTAQAGQPEVTIRLDDAAVEVDVGPGANGEAVFTGTVTCDMTGLGQNVQSVEVTLEADCRWPSTVSPSKMIFEPWGEDTADFEVTVRVAQFTSASQSDLVRIGGTAITQPGALRYEIAPVTGVIEINPYATFQISCEKPKYKAETGEKVSFSLRVKNDGNTREKLAINIDDGRSTIDDSWVLTFDMVLIQIEEAQEELITLEVFVPEDASSGSYSITVVIEAEAAMDGNETFVQDYTLFVVVDAGGVFGLGSWSWYILFIIIAALIGLGVWKRELLVSKFRRRTKK